MRKLLLIVCIITVLSFISCSGREAVEADSSERISEFSEAETDRAKITSNYTDTDTEAVSDYSQDEKQTDITQITTEYVTELSTDTEEVTVPPVIPEKGTYTPAVFMYHLILDEPYSPYENLFVRPSEFEGQVKILNSLGYSYEFAENYGTKEYPTAILTFDDGYEDNYTEMFPILKKYNAKATVFLATSLIGTEHYLTESQIKEMSDSGLVSFQSHTVNHSDLTYLNEAYIRSEMENSISIIEGLTGKKVNSFAYPAGKYNALAVSVVGEYVSFAYTTASPYNDSSDNPLLIPRHRIPRGYPDSAMRGIGEDYAG